MVFFIILLSCAFSLHQAMGQPTAVVSVQPANISDLTLGETFSINLTISNVTNLAGWQFTLYYQSTVLNLTASSPSDAGSILPTGNAILFTLDFQPNYNATTGLITLWYEQIKGSVVGVNGSGLLATISFTVIGSGGSFLHLGDGPVYLNKLTDSKNNLIPFTVVNGEVMVVPEFPSLAILPLFMIVTLVSLVAFRRWKMTDAKPKQ